jgi:hypothetical protein
MNPKPTLIFTIFFSLTLVFAKGQKIDSVRIDLQSNFHSQLVKIKYLDSVVFSNKITTNPSVGYAKKVWVKYDERKSAEIHILTDSVTLNVNLKKYPHKYLGICFNKKMGLFVNEVSDKPIIYN